MQPKLHCGYCKKKVTVVIFLSFSELMAFYMIFVAQVSYKREEPFPGSAVVCVHSDPCSKLVQMGALSNGSSFTDSGRG